MTQGDQHLDRAIDVSIEALKALVLVNGGAATALIALTDKSGAGATYATSVLLFGLGAFFGMLAFAAGYLSQLSYGNHRFAFEQGSTASADSAFKAHNRWQNIALGLVAASLLSASGGMISAFLANVPNEDDDHSYSIIRADEKSVLRLDEETGEMTVCPLPASGAVVCQDHSAMLEQSGGTHSPPRTTSPRQIIRQVEVP